MWAKLKGVFRKEPAPPVVPQPAPAAPLSEGSPTPGFGAEHIEDEHFVPESGIDLETYIERQDHAAIHHLVRYKWAAAYLASRPRRSPLLDLGCGSGYGAYELARALPDVSIRAVDYDPKAIDAAVATYSRENLSFVAADPLRWSRCLGPEKFQTIVCFDVIEHVQHREILMENVVRHLADDGLLLLSTPCGTVENILRPGWEFHRIEYGTASLYDFLRRYFGRVLGSQQDDFPQREVFTTLHERGIPYALKLNPVICFEPIRVPNPFPYP